LRHLLSRSAGKVTKFGRQDTLINHFKVIVNPT
jgi:hypothetical protein